MTVVSASGAERLDDLQLYEVCDVMRMLRLSRTVIYELIRSGRLRSVKQGRARRIPASAIRDYIALLEREAEQRRNAVAVEMEGCTGTRSGSAG
jgi:excisionase family DNA binding protein